MSRIIDFFRRVLVYFVEEMDNKTFMVFGERISAGELADFNRCLEISAIEVE